jgi:hypothetical protein
MVGVRTSRKPYCRYWVRRKEMSLLMTWAPLGRKRGEPGLYVDEVKSSWLVPRARWSFGGIEGAWELGRPLAASAHEHWRDAVDESHCVLAEGHCRGRLIANREMRRGRSRVPARMVALRRTVLVLRRGFTVDPDFLLSTAAISGHRAIILLSFFSPSSLAYSFFKVSG